VRAKLALDDSADLVVVATAVRKSMNAKDYHISAATIRSMRHKYVNVEYRRDEQDAASQIELRCDSISAFGQFRSFCNL
jgi:hypothetical protein